jgi:hypothetical protein
MLTQTQVRRYSAQSGLRDMMIAEKEVVLTFLLQLLSERGILDRLAFKGGTALRKMFIGSQGRFSTDLDFTGLEEHDHEDVILAMMGAFEQEFHGIRFHIPDNSYYETQDGLSWGVNPTYAHEWNGAGDSEIKLQISRRETPTLPPERKAQCEQSYFELLPFISGLVNKSMITKLFFGQLFGNPRFFSSDNLFVNAISQSNRVSRFDAPELYSSIIFWNSSKKFIRVRFSLTI